MIFCYLYKTRLRRRFINAWVCGKKFISHLVNVVKMYKNIEFVCSGNNGRSPIAELIARNYLLKIGADSEYGAISSGTMVGIMDLGRPIECMLPLINAAKQRGAYNEEDLKQLEWFLETRNNREVREYFKQASAIFAKEEREKLIKEFGIEGTVKKEKNRTMKSLDSIAVLPLDRKNYQEVLWIYHQATHAPLISVMSVLATGDLHAEVPNSFGKGIEAYRQAVEQLIREVPEVVRRIVGA